MLKIDGYFKGVDYAVNAFVKELNQQLADQIKVLFEDKHLYQRVHVEPEPIVQEILNHVVKDMSTGTMLVMRKILRQRLTPASTTHLRSVPVDGEIERFEATLPLLNVRLLCTSCDERSVFAPIWYRDLSNELLKPYRGEDGFQTNADLFSHQLVFVAMQCQHCKGLPEGFLVRRDGWTFSLDGRSPIEHVAVPQYIPKQEASLFRDALIGRFTGKNLAAAFYLRSFIEQFARRQTQLRNVRRTGDEIMDAYAQTIPEKQRAVIPSLKEWYDKLSVPLHSADDDAAQVVFDATMPAIENHFDARRALKVEEVK